MLSWINIAYTVIMCGFTQIYILNQIIRLMSFNVVSRFLPCLQRWTGVKRPKVWQGSFEQLSLWYIDDKSKINLKLMRLLYTLVSSSLCLQKDVYGLHRVQGLTGKSRKFSLGCSNSNISGNIKDKVMKFCQFIENTNGTNFLSNLATFGQYEVFQRPAKHGNPWVISAISSDLTAFLMSLLRAVMLLCELSLVWASICV